MTRVDPDKLELGKTYFCFIKSNGSSPVFGYFTYALVGETYTMLSGSSDTWDGKSVGYKKELFSAIYEIEDIVWNE